MSLYAPLKRKILTPNNDAVSLILKIRQGEPVPNSNYVSRVIDQLRLEGIIDSDDSNPAEFPSHEYKPLRLIIFPTSDIGLSDICARFQRKWCL